jgi:hypothetical protein
LATAVSVALCDLEAAVLDRLRKLSMQWSGRAWAQSKAWPEDFRLLQHGGQAAHGSTRTVGKISRKTVHSKVIAVLTALLCNRLKQPRFPGGIKFGKATGPLAGSCSTVANSVTQGATAWQEGISKSWGRSPRIFAVTSAPPRPLKLFVHRVDTGKA